MPASSFDELVWGKKIERPNFHTRSAATPVDHVAVSPTAEPKPEIEHMPIVLRDGRRLHRLPARKILAAFDTMIIELMDRARRLGAVLVTDGMSLDVVEPRHRLPPELLADLRRDAGAAIAALRGESRRRSAGEELVTGEAAVEGHDGR